MIVEDTDPEPDLSLSTPLSSWTAPRPQIFLGLDEPPEGETVQQWLAKLESGTFTDLELIPLSEHGERMTLRQWLAESEFLGFTELALRASEGGEFVEVRTIEPTFEAHREFYQPALDRDFASQTALGKMRRKNTENAKKLRESRQHPRKAEALAALEEKLRTRPHLSVSGASTQVAASMGEDAPSPETIRKWHRESKKAGG